MAHRTERRVTQRVFVRSGTGGVKRQQVTYYRIPTIMAKPVSYTPRINISTQGI